MDSVYLAHWIDSILSEDDIHPACTKSSLAVGNSCLSPELIELIVNICDELSLSPEVEFTCLDNFDVYCRRRHADILEMVAETGNRSFMTSALSSGMSYSSNSVNNLTTTAGVSTAAGIASTSNSSCTSNAVSFASAFPNQNMLDAWQREIATLVNDAPIRLVAMLMLSAKMIGNGAMQTIKLRTIVGMMRALRPQLTETDMKLAEYEVSM